MKEMNKRGQQMTLTTIIAIVLGIAVLVFLIFGFTTGWNNLWDKVTNYGGGSSNVDTIVQACDIACSTGSEYNYCTLNRTLKTGVGDPIPGSCNELTDYVNLCPGLC